MLFLASAICFLAGFLTMQLVDWVSLIPWRKSKGEHWTERARILWPARKTSSVLMLYVPLLLSLGCGLFWQANGWERMLCWFTATAGSVGGGWFMTRELFPGIQFRSWLHEVVISWLLRLGIWAVLLSVGFSMPAKFSSQVWLSLAGVAVLQVVWFSLALRLLGLFGILKPAGDRLMRIVSDCVKESGIEVKSVHQMRGISANAFALPLGRALLFCDRLMDVLTDEEVAAICAHEVGHLAESKWIVACRCLGTMYVLPLLLLHPAWGEWGLGGIYAIVLLMLVWSRLSLKLIRRMETRADSIASSQHSSDGLYAGALEKLYEANQVPAISPGKNSTHPHLYDRMLEAGSTPTFARPEPPEKLTPLGWLVALLAPFLLVWIVMRIREDKQTSHRPIPEERGTSDEH